jgi:RNA polymerase sigma factor (sigma-70 family)
MNHRAKSQGGGSAFPPTQHSTIRAVWSADAGERSSGYEALISAYWMPVYKYVRIRWGKSIDDAKDLTQGFFLQVMEKNFFRTFDPGKARFRTFLRTCLDGYISNQEKSAQRLKRGGDLEILSIDFHGAENQIGTAPESPEGSTEEFFEKEWRRSIFNLALELFKGRLAEHGKQVQFELFEAYVLNEGEEGRRIRYEDLARQFGLTIATVTNYLAAARREFRRAVFDKLKELTVNDDEFRREARALLGVEPE